MATVASETPAAGQSPWLADREHELRVHAIIGDLEIPLDEWCDGHEEQFLGRRSTAKCAPTRRPPDPCRLHLRGTHATSRIDQGRRSGVHRASGPPRPELANTGRDSQTRHVTARCHRTRQVSRFRVLRHGGGWPPLTSAAVPETLPSRIMVFSASAWPSTYRSKKASVTRARRRSTGFVPWYGIRWLAPNRSR